MPAGRDSTRPPCVRCPPDGGIHKAAAAPVTRLPRLLAARLRTLPRQPAGTPNPRQPPRTFCPVPDDAGERFDSLQKYGTGVRPGNIIPQKSCGLPSKVFGRFFTAFVHNIQNGGFLPPGSRSGRLQTRKIVCCGISQKFRAISGRSFVVCTKRFPFPDFRFYAFFAIF